MNYERETFNEKDYNPEQYWADSRARKCMFRNLRGKGERWEDINSISSEFIGVATMPRLIHKRASPASSIHPSQLEEEVRRSHGFIELHSSRLQKDDHERQGYPVGVPLILDVEYYDHKDPERVFRNSREVFHEIEPAYQAISDVFKKYGIPYLSVLTGKGYHFSTYVPSYSPEIDDLIRIGNVIEPTVAGKQKTIPPDTKRERTIPKNSELSFKGAVRLQQFILNKAIAESRKSLGNKMNVEISDKGDRGISFDNTVATRTVETSTTGVVGSPYFIKMRGKNTLIRLPRNLPDGSKIPLDELLEKRWDLKRSAELLGHVDTRIPDAGEGMKRLIADYDNSSLKKLHVAMDSSFGDDPKTFPRGYRRYDEIANRTRHPGPIRDMINNANDLLLKPDYLDFFIWEVFRSWGGSKDNFAPAPHVAGLLRAIYEDPRFKWEDRWHRHYDAFRHARGWTEIILGQALEEK